MQNKNFVSMELIQGEAFEADISWEDEDGTPVSVSGYTAKMQLRKNPGDPQVYLEASTANGMFTSDEEKNIIKLKIPAEEINELNFTSADADLFITSPSGDTYKLFKVRFSLTKRITV